MWRLRVSHAFLYTFDFTFDVSVGYEHVHPAVVVIVKKETTKAQRHQSRASDLRLRGLIHKQAVALIVVEREHLIGKVGDDETRAAGTVVVGSIHAHTGTGHSVFAEGDSSGNSLFLKRSVVPV